MKYFYISVTTQYDGMEWAERAVTMARNEQSARKKAEKIDFTHDDGYEEQEIDGVREIPKEDYEVLKKYLVEI